MEDKMSEIIKKEKNIKDASVEIIQEKDIKTEGIKEVKEKEVKVELAPCEKKMLEILERGGAYSIKELCDILKESKPGVIETAQQLKNKGFPIIKDGKNFYLDRKS